VGRFKNVEIKGLLIAEFEESFTRALENAIKTSKHSEKEITKRLEQHFKKLLSSYEESISSFYLEKHKFNLDAFLKSHFNNQRKIAEANKESFVSFILYVNACVVIYEKIINRIRRRKIDSTLKMNVALYGLVIRRAQEIVDLLLNGYVDGAMIIWRSLYENAIILIVLAVENENELADKFFQHSTRNSKRKILSYNNNHKELKFPPLPESTEKAIKFEAKIISERYGKEFLENDFGWADCLFPGKQRANFRLLEEKVEMNRFRPYYLVCCEHLHSNFNGFKNYMDGNKIILPRLLDPEIDLESFIDPMQFTVSVLHEVNDYILYEFSIEEEYNVNVLLLEKIFRKQQKTFGGNRK